MSMLAFDSHSHVKRLMAAGFTEAQAEAQTQALLDLLENRLVTKDDIRHLATKDDLHDLESSLRQDIGTLESSLRQDMTTLESSLRQGMAAMESSLRRDLASREDLKNMDSALRKDMEGVKIALQKDIQLLSNRLTIKLGSIMVAGITILAAMQFI
ncbi:MULTISPECIES: CCDC90 family protein [unclassified Ectothiorhodospira]|uniref:CCDC90 family protein n=1 Tax=unclassified Ectothiorhodospira TaxID=2684909 RepID=UPI001EE8395C|nr:MULTISPECIES: CCDC90 family protein [unclassified Ectothiorhodospira]MCG5514527.1 CCDC90 family protein [Ectothiorhodospira sp. 9100]MCG5518669.1 CCDC90 family protein [Ectothiorhodospira sp. 9905]